MHLTEISQLRAAAANVMMSCSLRADACIWSDRESKDPETERAYAYLFSYSSFAKTSILLSRCHHRFVCRQVNDSHKDAERESVGKWSPSRVKEERKHWRVQCQKEAVARARKKGICHRHTAFSVHAQGGRGSSMRLCAGVPHARMSTGFQARGTAGREGNPAQHHRSKDGEAHCRGRGRRDACGA